MKISRRILPALLALLTVTAACDDNDDMMQPELASVALSSSSINFGSLDVNLGATLSQSITITNTGSLPVAIGPVALTGAGAADYTLVEGGQATTLQGGASSDLVLTFDPSASGAREAVLDIGTDADAVGTLMVSLSGMGQSYTYAQVDRVGIPALNTVFNHPPQFSKTDYNTASPKDDVANYTGLFETVLGAVANPDPQGTAALLLPDELPVSLGAATSAFGTLTGRAPSDDAVDVALSVVVGIDALKSDNVDSNDRPFPVEFPYLAQPN